MWSNVQLHFSKHFKGRLQGLEPRKQKGDGHIQADSNRPKERLINYAQEGMFVQAFVFFLFNLF